MEFKMITTALLLVFCFCLRSHECSAAPKTMKTHVKAVQIDEGNVIDCVDIYNQPSLAHPLLKNHKVQLKPSAFPLDQEKSSLGTNIPSSEAGWFRNEICPDGTVPIYRTTEEEKIRAKNITKQLFHHSTGHRPNDPLFTNTHVVLVKINKTEKVVYFGAVGSSSIFNLSLTPNQISTANILVQAGPPDQLNYITAGSIVSQALNRDSRPRLFVYWTGDGNKKTGCFNIICKGFMQVSPSIAPGGAFEPVSTIGGKIYDAKFNIYQDPITGNWWLVVLERNLAVGYWPKELLPQLANGASEVAWGGISAGSDAISPPMGSGRYPDGFYDTAAYFRNLHFIKEGLKQISPQNSDKNVQEVVDTSGCFKLQNEKLTLSGYWGYRFTFGGPGGTTCDH